MRGVMPAFAKPTARSLRLAMLERLGPATAVAG
jgi:hypothetical protein